MRLVSLRRQAAKQRKRPRPAWRWLLFCVVGACVLVALVLLIQFVALHSIPRHGALSPADRERALNDARTSLIQLLGGVALLSGAVFTARTHLLAKRTQRNDRFVKCVEQLGSESAATRTGAAFGLWLLAEDEPSYWPAVEELLSSLVRERSPCQPVKQTPGPDVHAAMAALCRRPSRAPGEEQTFVNLRGVELTGVDLHGANLGLALLDGARLDDAVLVGANLRRASLVAASLNDADLSNADLEHADLSSASVLNASLWRTNLFGVIATNCDLTLSRDITSEQISSVAVS